MPSFFPSRRRVEAGDARSERQAPRQGGLLQDCIADKPLRHRIASLSRVFHARPWPGADREKPSHGSGGVGIPSYLVDGQHDHLTDEGPSERRRRRAGQARRDRVELPQHVRDGAADKRYAGRARARPHGIGAAARRLRGRTAVARGIIGDATEQESRGGAGGTVGGRRSQLQSSHRLVARHRLSIVCPSSCCTLASSRPPSLQSAVCTTAAGPDKASRSVGEGIEGWSQATLVHPAFSLFLLSRPSIARASLLFLFSLSSLPPSPD